MSFDTYRIALGVFILLVIDLIWIASIELSRQLFVTHQYEKPFFLTYVRSITFTIYLVLYILIRTHNGLQSTCKSLSPTGTSISNVGSASSTHSKDTIKYHRLNQLDDNAKTEAAATDEDDKSKANTGSPFLTESSWVPVVFDENNCELGHIDKLLYMNDINGNHRVNSVLITPKRKRKSVHFNQLAEVKYLTPLHTNCGFLSKFHLNTLLQYGNVLYSNEATKSSVSQTFRLAVSFALIWFLANYSLQLALYRSHSSFIIVIFCSVSLFIMVFNLLIGTEHHSDQFTISKLVAILISLSGLFIISLNETPSKTLLGFDNSLLNENNANASFSSITTSFNNASDTLRTMVDQQSDDFYTASSWALVAALCYALYLTVLKYRVVNVNQLDMPLFLGFIGLLDLVTLWPVFLMLHYLKIEEFELPNHEQWMLILVNGIIGTFFVELLWLWCCFITSTLMSTLSLALIVPMKIIIDVFINSIAYPSLFFFGVVTLLISLAFVMFISHYENTLFSSWDPIAVALHKCFRYRYHWKRSRLYENNQNSPVLLVPDEH